MHPAADLFPLMTGAAFDELLRDVERNGLLHPITLLGGRVLDGRNRLRACKQLGMRPRFVEARDVESPTAYVVSANLARRHLGPAQRAAVAVLAQEHFRQGPVCDDLDGLLAPGESVHVADDRRVLGSKHRAEQAGNVLADDLADGVIGGRDLVERHAPGARDHSTSASALRASSAAARFAFRLLLTILTMYSVWL